MAQPSATQALADLERLLETALFLRHSRGMTLTPVGHVLLPMAQRVLELVDEGATNASIVNERATSVVRVVAIAAAMPSFLALALPKFCRDHPEIFVHLQQADSAHQAPLIASREVDIAICRRPAVVPDGWVFTPLLKDRFVIACGLQHPLANKRRVSLKELQSAKWLTVPVNIAARPAFDSLFEGEKISPNIHNIVTVVPELVRPMLSDEDVLTLLPASLVRSDFQSGKLCEVPYKVVAGIAEIGMLTLDNGQVHGLAMDTFRTALVKFARHAEST